MHNIFKPVIVQIMINLLTIFGSMKDEQAGEVPVAFVVRSNGSTITEDEVKDFISKQVSFIKFICFFL